jgi:hypothetical protein
VPTPVLRAPRLMETEAPTFLYRYWQEKAV